MTATQRISQLAEGKPVFSFALFPGQTIFGRLGFERRLNRARSEEDAIRNSTSSDSFIPVIRESECERTFLRRARATISKFSAPRFEIFRAVV
jgi:hypothetical protein